MFLTAGEKPTHSKEFEGLSKFIPLLDGNSSITKWGGQ
jgi:hypothetical protein